MLQIDRLQRAALLAPDLPEPSSDNAAGTAIRAEASTLQLFLIAWSAGALFMLGGATMAPLPWLIGMIAILVVGFRHVGVELAAVRRRLNAPLERAAVEVIAKQTKRRYRHGSITTVTVHDRDGKRRELLVAHDPGMILVGDVGVLFSRADAVWDFHRVDRDARY